jgi:hypothetical protein
VKVYKFAKFYTHCCSLTHTSIDKWIKLWN